MRGWDETYPNWARRWWRRAGGWPTCDQKTHPQKPDRERGAPAFAPDWRKAKDAAQIARQKRSGQGAQFKRERPARLTEIAGPAPAQSVLTVGAGRAPLRTPPGDPRVWGRRGVHAPYATKYQGGYLHEAPEVDGENRVELLFTPSSTGTSPPSFSNKSPTQIPWCCTWSSGFHLPVDDPRLSKNPVLCPRRATAPS